MSELMRERYGTADPRRRIALVVATTLLALVFLGWLAWAAWFHSDPAIDAQLSAYDVVSAHEVRVKVATRMDDEVRGTCLVRATARDHTVVGEASLSAQELRDRPGEWFSVRTERRATTVELVRCTETARVSGDG